MILEVRTALRRSTKEDLFTGDIYNAGGKQSVKENTTVFFRNPNTGIFSGPKMIYTNGEFVELFCQNEFGLLGVITPMPEEITHEFIFDLVLREASVVDLKDTPKHIKLNRIYYSYSEGNLLGPFITDNSTTHEMLDKLIAKNQIFVPNERQHFKKKEYKKAA